MLFNTIAFRQPGIQVGGELVSQVRAKDGWIIESGKEGWVFCTPPHNGDTFCIPREAVTHSTIGRRVVKGKLRAA